MHSRCSGGVAVHGQALTKAFEKWSITALYKMQLMMLHHIPLCSSHLCLLLIDPLDVIVCSGLILLTRVQAAPQSVMGRRLPFAATLPVRL